jgi:hypothetical protein
MDEEEMFEIRVPRIMIFTVILVLIFAVYGAASVGRDLITLVLRMTGVL